MTNIANDKNEYRLRIKDRLLLTLPDVSGRIIAVAGIVFRQELIIVDHLQISW